MKKIYIVLICLLIPLVFQFSGGWIWTPKVDSHTTNEVTIAAASTSDTTAWFEGNRFMTVIPLPGASANNDSFSLTGKADSCMVDIYIEGWSNKFSMSSSPTGVCLARVNLWNPFTLQTYATSNEADSSYKVIDTASGSTLGKAYPTFAVNSVQEDSTRIVANASNAPIWPWCRLIVTDADTKTGKNWTAKFKIVGYTP